VKPDPDLFEPDGLDAWLARSEREPATSDELDFLADLVAAAERERATLAPPARVAPPRFPLRTWILPAAASVLFLFALGLWLAKPHRHETGRALAAREAPHYVATDLRAPGEGEHACFLAAMAAYGRADWSAAATALEQCLATDAEHAPTHFYLAAALEQLGELERAEPHYRRAAAAPDALLAGHARLRLGLVLVARGELARGRAELETLRDAGGEFTPLARAALDELDGR
jgi:tetratricopeptide (TPR) repeat protein